jgi:GT2 family glycosyltransferase
MAVCPDVITADGLHQNPHILKRISSIRRFQFDMYFSNYWVARLLVLLLRFIRPVKASREQTGEAHEMHMGVGACYILTSRFLARFKQLNYPHFLYGEEAYISDQIHTAGGILWYDPALCVHHAESAALSKIPRREAYEYERVGYPNYRSLL